MTQELGLMELIFGASALVQAVMLILVLASLSSWFLIVQRVMLMRRADDELLVFEERFWSGIDLAQLYREGNQAVADGQLPTGVGSVFRAGFKEFSRLSQQSDMDADAILEGSRRAMRVALMRETDRIEQHLPFLASVGSTSPYIGLLGTVWGIMHSFRGLANATQATLATVAPGSGGACSRGCTCATFTTRRWRCWAATGCSSGASSRARAASSARAPAWWCAVARASSCATA